MTYFCRICESAIGNIISTSLHLLDMLCHVIDHPTHFLGHLPCIHHTPWTQLSTAYGLSTCLGCLSTIWYLAHGISAPAQVTRLGRSKAHLVTGISLRKNSTPRRTAKGAVFVQPYRHLQGYKSYGTIGWSPTLRLTDKATMALRRSRFGPPT